MYNVWELLSMKGKVAMVTGGGQNLGLDMARALGETGADLVITLRQQEKVDRVAEMLWEELGVWVFPLQLDVTDKVNVKEVFEKVAEEYGRLDVLVNNAGGEAGVGAWCSIGN